MLEILIIILKALLMGYLLVHKSLLYDVPMLLSPVNLVCFQPNNDDDDVPLKNYTRFYFSHVLYCVSFLYLTQISKLKSPP